MKEHSLERNRRANCELESALLDVPAPLSSSHFLYLLFLFFFFEIDHCDHMEKNNWMKKTKVRKLL